MSRRFERGEKKEYSSLSVGLYKYIYTGGTHQLSRKSNRDGMKNKRKKTAKADACVYPYVCLRAKGKLEEQTVVQNSQRAYSISLLQPAAIVLS